MAAALGAAAAAIIQWLVRKPLLSEPEGPIHLAPTRTIPESSPASRVVGGEADVSLGFGFLVFLWFLFLLAGLVIPWIRCSNGRALMISVCSSVPGSISLSAGKLVDEDDSVLAKALKRTFAAWQAFLHPVQQVQIERFWAAIEEEFERMSALATRKMAALQEQMGALQEQNSVLAALTAAFEECATILQARNTVFEEQFAILHGQKTVLEEQLQAHRAWSDRRVKDLDQMYKTAESSRRGLDALTRSQGKELGDQRTALEVAAEKIRSLEAEAKEQVANAKRLEDLLAEQKGIARCYEAKAEDRGLEGHTATWDLEEAGRTIDDLREQLRLAARPAAPGPSTAPTMIKAEPKASEEEEKEKEKEKEKEEEEEEPVEKEEEGPVAAPADEREGAVGEGEQKDGEGKAPRRRKRGVKKQELMDFLKERALRGDLTSTTLWPGWDEFKEAWLQADRTRSHEQWLQHRKKLIKEALDQVDVFKAEEAAKRAAAA